MNRKVITLIAFALMVFSFYQCGNKEGSNASTAAAANPTNTAAVSSTAASTSRPAPGAATISGNLANAANLKVFVDQSSVDNTSNRVIGRGEIDGSGNFSVAIPEGFDTGIYRFRVGAQKSNLIFNGGEKNVKISGDLNAINTFGIQVEGSEPSTEFFQMMQGFVTQRPTVEQAKAKLMAAKSPLVSMLGANIMFPATAGLEVAQTKVEIQKMALAKMKSQFPNAQITKDAQKSVATLDSQVKAQLAQQKVRIGEEAPDITLTSPDGKSYSLSQLKGKVVLLDFWASWCGPCRRENPNVVSTYKKYNKEGFEVFSVSLDGIHPRVMPRLKDQAQIDQQMTSAKNKWVQAIEKDQLMWPYHVSDLQHWSSPVAKSYGVSSIPKTFLIGRDGKIAAINPRGAALEPALKKLL